MSMARRGAGAEGRAGRGGETKGEGYGNAFGGAESGGMNVDEG